MVERFFYDSDEKLDRKYIWKYNDKNRLVVIIKIQIRIKVRRTSTNTHTKNHLRL